MKNDEREGLIEFYNYLRKNNIIHDEEIADGKMFRWIDNFINRSNDKSKLKIIGFRFDRDNNEIILDVDGDVPASGIGVKKIIKMLRKFYAS